MKISVKAKYISNNPFRLIVLEKFCLYSTSVTLL